MCDIDYFESPSIFVGFYVSGFTSLGLLNFMANLCLTYVDLVCNQLLTKFYILNLGVIDRFTILQIINSLRIHVTRNIIFYLNKFF